MAKDKKKHSKKDKVSAGILDAATLSVRKFRKVTKEIGKLSTGQKLVGGAALLAAGLTYLAKKQPRPAASAFFESPPGDEPRPNADGAATGPADEEDVASAPDEVAERARKTGKRQKSK